jgi:hypothetical protein
LHKNQPEASARTSSPPAPPEILKKIAAERHFSVRFLSRIAIDIGRVHCAVAPWAANQFVLPVPATNRPEEASSNAKTSSINNERIDAGTLSAMG